MINSNQMNDLEVLRMAERERGKAIASFFRKLFTTRSNPNTGFTGGVVAAE